MLNVQGKRMVVMCALALGATSWSKGVRAVEVGDVGAGSRAQRVSAGVRSLTPLARWNSFSADVTIRRGLRDADHKAIGEETPGIRYKWRRVQSAGYWKTTMEVVSATRASVITSSSQAQAIPPAIARVEDPGDGTGPRFFTSSGRLVQAPRLEDRNRLHGADAGGSRTDALLGTIAMLDAGGGRAPDEGRGWIDAVMPGVDRKQARRTSLQARFGKAAGKLRGLDRYLTTTGTETVELLADADWNVPVEVNVVRDGALQEHMTFGYDAGPGGARVRRRVHAEHVIPEAHGARMALDVELANVTLTNALEGGR